MKTKQTDTTLALVSIVLFFMVVGGFAVQLIGEIILHS